MSTNKPSHLEVKASKDKTTLNIYGAIGLGDIEARDVITAIDNTRTPELTVRVNSEGGSAKDGIAIYNRLREFPGTVNTTVDAAAWSAASVVALAGESREMLSGSTMMIHNAWNVVAGDHNEMRRTADIVEQVSDNLAAIYEERTSLTREHARELMAAETWIYPEDAFELGFTTSEPSTAMAMFRPDMDLEHCRVYRNMPKDVRSQLFPVAEPKELQPQDRLFQHLMETRLTCGDLARVAGCDLETVRGYMRGETTPLANLHFQAFAQHLPQLGSLVTLKHLARLDGVTF